MHLSELSSNGNSRWVPMLPADSKSQSGDGRRQRYLHYWPPRFLGTLSQSLCTTGHVSWLHRTIRRTSWSTRNPSVSKMYTSSRLYYTNVESISSIALINCTVEVYINHVNKQNIEQNVIYFFRKYLGRSVQVPIQSCTIKKIRETFTSPDYCGFKHVKYPELWVF